VLLDYGRGAAWRDDTIGRHPARPPHTHPGHGRVCQVAAENQAVVGASARVPHDANGDTAVPAHVCHQRHDCHRHHG